MPPKSADRPSLVKSPAPPEPPAPPLPPGLAAPEIAGTPAPMPRPFAFGALLMRVDDNGAIQTDVAAGFAYGFSREQAEGDFLANVRRAYPGHSITKALGQEVLPLATLPPAEPSPAPPEA